MADGTRSLALAWSQKACRNPEIDPHSYFGDDFMIGLMGWCRTKKATGIFFWMICGVFAVPSPPLLPLNDDYVCTATWLANLIMYIILSRREASSSPLSRYQSTRNPGRTEYTSTADAPRFVSTLPASAGRYDAEPKPAAYAPTYGAAGREADDEEQYAEDAAEGDVGYASLSYARERRTVSPLPRVAEPTKPLSRTMQLAKTDYSDPCESRDGA